jgi:hypothetical protein
LCLWQFQEDKLFAAPDVYILGTMYSADPQLREFILFCVERRGKEWPALYDEMARVAGQRLFRGLGYAELKQIGLSLAVSNLDCLIRFVERVTSQEVTDQQA